MSKVSANEVSTDQGNNYINSDCKNSPEGSKRTCPPKLNRKASSISNDVNQFQVPYARVLSMRTAK